MNKVILMGRLTRDPELRHTQSNMAVCSFSLAIDRGRKDQNGERQTDFIDCVRSRQKFALNEENGFRSATIVNMGAVALRLGRNLKFDPDKLLFVDDEAANRLIDQPMRYPWTL